MLKTEHYCIAAKNIAAHELIGLQAAVRESTDKGRIGLKGKIVDETKNLIVMETGAGEKKLPKREIKLEIALGSEKVLLDCGRIMQRPEDRVKYHGR